MYYLNFSLLLPIMTTIKERQLQRGNLVKLCNLRKFALHNGTDAFLYLNKTLKRKNTECRIIIFYSLVRLLVQCSKIVRFGVIQSQKYFYRKTITSSVPFFTTLFLFFSCAVCAVYNNHYVVLDTSNSNHFSILFVTVE